MLGTRSQVSDRDEASRLALAGLSQIGTCHASCKALQLAMLDCRRGLFQIKVELSMKKIILVGLAIFAVSTSGALAAKKTAKPKAPAAAATTTNTGGAAPLMMGQVSAADRELYAKSQRESGMKK